MKPDPIKRLKQRLTDASGNYVAVFCGDIVSACDQCGPLDEVIGALWKGSHELRPEHQVAIKRSDLAHLMELLDRPKEPEHGPAEQGSDVPGEEVQSERGEDDNVPPKRRKRGH